MANSHPRIRGLHRMQKFFSIMRLLYSILFLCKPRTLEGISTKMWIVEYSKGDLNFFMLGFGATLRGIFKIHKQPLQTALLGKGF